MVRRSEPLQASPASKKPAAAMNGRTLASLGLTAGVKVRVAGAQGAVELETVQDDAVADRAVRTLPALRDVRVVRSWAALRVMSKDGFPIYQQSETCPGAFVATCHSGVTLAAAHALNLAPMIVAGKLAAAMAPCSPRRVHGQEA
ncbi:hypothetical protein G6F32_015680 [Rhizopus arrhizus]|nr:hypothetical protein G6F32_015680 [Rhizopus arrhizus]